MDISVTEPIGQAYAEMKRILFKPFDIGKWFTLGFCAFLANICDCKGPNGPNGDEGDGSKFGFRSFGEVKAYAIDWISDKWEWIVSIGWVASVFILLLIILFLWLSSRGKFMLLDGVVHNRGAVVKPWHKFKDLANSLFLWRFILFIFGLATMMSIVFISILIAWTDIKAERFDSNAIMALTIGISLFVAALICFDVLGQMLTDFVTPIMYKRGILGGEAIGIFRREILANHGGTFILFYLMKFLLVLAMIIIVILFCILTCCVILIPIVISKMMPVFFLPFAFILHYIFEIIFLPFTVFFRCYSLYFLEQFEPQWRLLGVTAEVKQENS
ncbi:hypothetical protein ACFL02_05625 [Planctomycetota bacterium]